MTRSTGRLKTDESICSGCRACELACSFYHTRSFSPDLARIWVSKDEPSGRDTPHVCLQCDDARCINTCPAGALSRDMATGAVRCDEDACVGCGACLLACAGYLRAHPTLGYPLVCDLCGGSPRCARRCPTGAVSFDGTDETSTRSGGDI